MPSMSSLWRWAVTSNERAVANARDAAIECSRHRVERAEVEQFLAAYATGRRRTVDLATGAVATGH
jgi:hypothetical protein